MEDKYYFDYYYKNKECYIGILWHGDSNWRVGIVTDLNTVAQFNNPWGYGIALKHENFIPTTWEEYLKIVEYIKNLEKNLNSSSIPHYHLTDTNCLSKGSEYLRNLIKEDNLEVVKVGHCEKTWLRLDK